MLTTPENILITLGYGRTIPVDAMEKLDDIGYYLGDRIDSIMTAIEAIDTTLQAAPLDSMAVKIDKLEVSYSQHLTLLKQEGSRLIAELSRLTDIEITFDKYKGKSTQTRVNSRHNFVSYW